MKVIVTSGFGDPYKGEVVLDAERSKVIHFFEDDSEAGFDLGVDGKWYEWNDCQTPFTIMEDLD